MGNKPRHRGQDGPPSLETEQKIKALRTLRAKIRMGQFNYRVVPSRELEIALQKLIRQESDLSAEVGFGATPGNLPSPPW